MFYAYFYNFCNNEKNVENKMCQNLKNIAKIVEKKNVERKRDQKTRKMRTL